MPRHEQTILSGTKKPGFARLQFPMPLYCGALAGARATDGLFHFPENVLRPGNTLVVRCARCQSYCEET
jgi:hypothetical protein